MSKEQAFKLLQEAVAMLRLTKQEHEILQNALLIVADKDKKVAISKVD